MLSPAEGYLSPCPSLSLSLLALCSLPLPPGNKESLGQITPLHVVILGPTFPYIISLLCHPYLPAALSKHRLSVSLLVLLPATLFPSLMLRPTEGQRASSWSRGLYFHSIVTCAAIFLSIMASIIVPIDHNTREPGRAVLSMLLGLGPLSLSGFWICLWQKTILQTGHRDPMLSKSGQRHGQAFSFCDFFYDLSFIINM
jgi:hypothetical protein